jgi:hypothetical protein
VRFLSGEELDAAKMRLRNLEQEAEVARSARAAVSVVGGLNLAGLEIAGKAIRAAIKGWDQGKAEAFAAVVGPIEARMSEVLNAPVKVDPGDNWTITVQGREAESYSGGQRLGIWAAFVGALAKPGDVLLCEAAEADPERLALMLAALAPSRADLIVLATHIEPPQVQDWKIVRAAEVGQ